MTDFFHDTIVAPATVPGTGAISIVRVSGPKAFSIVDAVVQLKSGTISSSAAYTIHFASVFTDGNLLDEVLVSVFRAPHSYTGEDSVEISCHASSFIVSELVRLLIEAGCRMAEPGEFTKRAFLNGKMDLAQAESVADVISSSTSASHRVAMKQLKGGYSLELLSLREELLEMTSLLELELDFSEEEVEFADRERLLALVNKVLEHVTVLVDSFRLGNAIKNGVPVAIVGAANAGKSTLLNALVGDDRAIVSDIAGTTRDTIEETVNLDGVLFRFMDTAGIRETSETVEKMGIERTFRKISDASIVLAMLDATEPESLLLQQIELLLPRLDFSSQTLFLLLNKCDLLSNHDINKIVTSLNNFVFHADCKANIFTLSAKTQKGLPELRKAMISLEKDIFSDADATFVTNARHYESLKNTASALADVRASLLSPTPSDLVAEELRRAISSINLILGSDLGLSPDTVLHHIFRNHCIGK